MHDRTDAADAAGILDAIETEQRHAQESLAPDSRLLYGVWGGAWVLGFGAVYAALVPEGSPLLPLPVALAIAGLVLVAAIVISSVHATRRGRGTRGPSNVQGAIHGNTFAVAFLLMGLLGWRLTDAGTPAEAMLAYWTVVPCLIVGGLGIAGAAIWNDRSQLVFSAWVLVIGFIATWVPAPHLLLVGVGGGVGFLVLAVIAAARPALLAGPIVGRRG